MKQLDYIVTGTGCCGTGFVARALSSAGIACTHEGIFTEFGIDEALQRLQGLKPIISSDISTRKGDWLDKNAIIVADSSYFAAPFLQNSITANATIIHLVRDPIKVITGFVIDSEYFDPATPKYKITQCNKFINQHLPQILSYKSPFDRAALFYISWNKMIEKNKDIQSKKYIFHRIEDDISMLFEKLQIDQHSLTAIDKKTNTKRHRLHTEDIGIVPSSAIQDELITIAEQYGYNLEKSPKTPRIFL